VRSTEIDQNSSVVLLPLTLDWKQTSFDNYLNDLRFAAQKFKIEIPMDAHNRPYMEYISRKQLSANKLVSEYIFGFYGSFYTRVFKNNEAFQNVVIEKM
jgi:hypothetical protein